MGYRIEITEYSRQHGVMLKGGGGVGSRLGFAASIQVLLFLMLTWGEMPCLGQCQGVRSRRTNSRVQDTSSRCFIVNILCKAARHGYLTEVSCSGQ